MNFWLLSLATGVLLCDIWITVVGDPTSRGRVGAEEVAIGLDRVRNIHLVAQDQTADRFGNGSFAITWMTKEEN